MNKKSEEPLLDLVPRPDPTLLTTAALKLSIDNLKELLETKLKNIEDRVTQFEVLRLEQKQDNQKAIDAALSAQEKRFEQSGAAMTKQVDALGDLVNTKTSSLDEKINDQKTRREDQGRQTQGWLIPMVVVSILSFLNLAVTVVVLITRH